MPLTLSCFKLVIPYGARLASTQASSFPYPTQPNPTPQQIFHLPSGASQQDIKARYYDLVRAHHPDSPSCRHIAASERHARFQAISSAYDVLRGRKPPPRDVWCSSEMRAELARRRSHHQRGTRADRHGWGSEFAARHGAGAECNWHSAWDGDDRWKDRVIIGVGLFSLSVGLAPIIIWNPISLTEQRHLAAAANLAEARREAREYGRERRREIRRRVQAQESEDRRLQEDDEGRR